MWKIFAAVIFCVTLVSASCPAACQCPPDVPVCAAGVGLEVDSCGCCKVCARQLNEDCSKARPCDTAKGLECNFGGGSDLAPGICRAKRDGRSCEFNSRIYQHGETFQTSCKYQCTCTDGYIRCASLCNHDLSYGVGCAKLKKVKAKGKCCERLICLKDANTGRSVSWKHRQKSSNDVSDKDFSKKYEPGHNWRGEVRAFRNHTKRRKITKGSQCHLQATAWSPCSTSCGPGVSTRVTNNNTECKLMTETQTCEIQSCKEMPTKSAENCNHRGKAVHLVRMSYGGCHSMKTFQLKHCGSCSDGRCCHPHRTQTQSVRFKCKTGQTLRRKVLRTESCRCDFSCIEGSKKMPSLRTF